MAGPREQAEDGLYDVSRAEHSALRQLYSQHEGFILGMVSVLVFLVIWELVGGTWELINPLFISSPSRVWTAAGKLFETGEIWHDLKVSGIEFLFGFLASVVVGIPLGIALGWYGRFNHVLNPFVSALYATPRVAFLPLIIIWLGIGIYSKIGIIFLGAVFPILMNTRDAVKTTPVNLLQAAHSFGASQWMVFRSVVLPASVPFVLAGLRLGVGRALIGVFVGELYVANAGIGFMIREAGDTFQTDKALVGVVIFAIVGMLSIEGLTHLERVFDKWRPAVRGAE